MFTVTFAPPRVLRARTCDEAEANESRKLVAHTRVLVCCSFADLRGLAVAVTCVAVALALAVACVAVAVALALAGLHTLGPALVLRSDVPTR